MPAAPPPTMGETLSMIPKAFFALGSVSYALLTRPLASSPRPVDAFRDAVFAAMRSFLSGITTSQEQASQVSTEAQYLAVSKYKHYTPDTDVLDSGLRVHWLGPKLSRSTIVFLHGGGFNLAASSGHLEWLWDLKNDLAQQASISVVIPSYTLAPEGQYPLQLRQAAEVLQWLVEKQGKSPGNIILAGDSAGANLSVAVLSHLLHPHPDVPAIKLLEPLAAAVLISPWTRFVSDDESVTRNASSDMVTVPAAKRWSSNYLGPAELDFYNQPADADEQWFSGLDRKVKDMFVYAGGGEILIDSIELFVQKLRQAHPRVEYVVQPGVAHDDIILDKVLGYKKKAEGTKLIESWIAQRCTALGY
ncbi:hypothetical protein LTR91_002756 [Friedmanniomyces endolithicus]|uniref:Alpha/beta hydrolase fold-3 domain-containing protein n=1 Tax=Friedmanniomyces endolithicus TaxID=329885 RepID=A0A4U0UJ39_9PEZI|nr:hypothetical protein LTS09_010525 [Friedmanniomyces endolithicus]KAK0283337.1 hypothetical protein LTR35_006411 [Friedmanniomyces endolithicus]KAK0298602.1 hypothetical protein LTS00_002984 [Friedmanniomyces endolithicus]KAK0328204.1 hypothetical protein LTR82_000132 [Friedmanniomyces endolithicus]KAK0920788.1 hypothetical protein LTR57_009461 [Friedmanniomyces endolithicus]